MREGGEELGENVESGGIIGDEDDFFSRGSLNGVKELVEYPEFGAGRIGTEEMRGDCFK